MQRFLFRGPIFLFLPLVIRVLSFPTYSAKPPAFARQCRRQLIEDSNEDLESSVRRAVLLGFSTTALLGPREPASAAGFFQNKLGLYVVDTKDDIMDEILRTDQVDAPVPTLSSERALLELLPIKNPVFRTLESNIKSLSAVLVGGTYA
jgi:hypothetical protein